MIRRAVLMTTLLWLKLIGWALFIIPMFAFVAFSIWVIRETMNDDENIGAFVGVMLVIWIIGAGLLALAYFSDFAATRLS